VMEAVTNQQFGWTSGIPYRPDKDGRKVPTPSFLVFLDFSTMTTTVKMCENGASVEFRGPKLFGDAPPSCPALLTGTSRPARQEDASGRSVFRPSRLSP
jgi:hypothetical protein